MARNRQFWVQNMHLKKGALRKELHVKSGHDIPLSRLRRAAKARGTLGKRARLALTFRRMRRIKFR